MKKTVCVLVALAVLISLGTPLGASASYTVRVDRYDSETVSYVCRYPRIYGLRDANAEHRLNLFLREKAEYYRRQAEYLAALGKCRTTGQLAVDGTYSGGGLICFRYEQLLDSDPEHNDRIYLTFDLKTGRLLHLSGLFLKDGAKADAVVQLFEAELRGRGGPDQAWVLKKIGDIWKMPFFLDGSGQCVTVIFTDGSARTFDVSVSFEALAPYLQSQYAFR